MMKSNFLALSGIAFTMIIFLADNLKLKSMYDAGEIQSGYVTRSLPPFHYINATGNTGAVEVRQGDSNTARIDLYDTAYITFNVVNDTLFIDTRHPAVNGDEVMNDLGRVSISAQTLNGINIHRRPGVIKNIKTESLTVNASGNSAIEVYALQATQAQFYILDSSSLKLENTPVLPNVLISIPGNGTLLAHDVLLQNKQVMFSQDAHVELSGRSMESFGLTTSK